MTYKEESHMKKAIETALFDIVDMYSKKDLDEFIDDMFFTKLTQDSGQKINDIFTKEMEAGLLLQYFSILDMYNKHKRKHNLTTKAIAEITSLPELTITRVENLQVVPKLSTILKMLDSVGLQFSINPVVEDNISRQ